MNSFFESYNAKHLKSDEIVRTFVSSKLFMEVARNGHSILVGPRGSGKTTFLRMLSNDTLYKWNDYQTKGLEKTISYEGIYVPGDIVWGEMLNGLEDIGLDEKYSKGFSFTAFCTHVFLSTIESIETSIERYREQHGTELLNDKAEVLNEALVSICRTLKLDLKVHSLSRIRLELNNRLVELGEYARKIAETSKVDSEEYLTKVPYSNIELKICLEAILSSIDQALGRNENRWAFLFDEFEIAPEFLLDSIISGMRSSAKKIMYKVALVPCGFHQKLKSSSSSLNDFTVVELWYVKKGESNNFCKSLLKTRYLIDDPERVFGNTIFGSSKSLDKTKWIKEFDELRSKDASFGSYLHNQKIDYAKELGADSSASNLMRKMAPIVAFRNAFLNKNGRRKGRKSLTEFYTGWEAITRISEGNPRWLISVLNSLITTDTDKKIPQSKQMEQIQLATDAYCAMLKTIPSKNNMGISSDVPIFTLMEKIGNYFNSRFIDESFRPSQPNTFIVDKAVSSEVEASLMIAWNYGAIVAVDTENSFGSYDNLIGMRFRLSFLTTPKFELPLRTDKSISLSKVLQVKKAKLEEGIIQGKLF